MDGLMGMYEVRRAAKGPFFSPDNTRFFRSHYSQTATRIGDVAYFVTSEQFNSMTPRYYTVRACNLITGVIDDIGGFMAHGTRTQAHDAIRRLMKARLIKVRVWFKNPLENKTGTIRMTEERIRWYRENKVSSPFKKLVRLAVA